MELDSDFDYTIKILVVGDSTVGKTNFIRMFIENKFNQNYMTTSGIDLKTSSIEIKNKKIRVQLWDTAGQEKYKAITKNLFLKVQAALIVYDITNEETFNNLKTWVRSIKEECGKQIQMLIIGNKNDLNEERVVDKNIAMEYAKEEKIDYLETSSKTGDNIQKAISLLCEKVLENTEFTNDFSFTLDASAISQKNKSKCCQNQN
jgi:Ras-related protein Rab-1A